jgi:hypothetical protein
MKIQKIYLHLLCLVLISFASINAHATFQSTFIKSGNSITVFIKSDQDYTDVGISGFYACFRYLNSNGVTLNVTNSVYSPVMIEQQYNDPTDANYRITVFGFYSGNPVDHSFVAGIEYPVFTFEITGGIGNGIFALVEDSPNYTYGYSYIEVDQATDLTNYVDPFYVSSHPLEITSKVVGSATWKYATEYVQWTADATTTDWNTGGNWNSATVPTAIDNIIITDASPQPIISNLDVVVNKLKFDDNATVEIAFDGTLTVASDITQGTGGGFIIRSTAAGTGSLIHATAGITGTVERHLKGWGSYSTELKNGHGWHLLSSPVTAQAIAPFQDLTDNDDFLKWNELENVWKNRRQGGGSTVPDPAFDTQFDVGTAGYLVAYEDDKDFAFDGVLNTADVAVTGLTNSYTSGSVKYYGHHLLGNPFASALTWDDDASWNLTNVGNYAQIWHEANASYSVLDPGDPIPAMQGFFVYTSGSGSLNIPASKRVHSAVPYYKDAPQQIVLTAHDLDHQMKQESKVAFNPDATEGFDLEHDAYFMGGYAPRFYSVSEGAAYALNTLPAMTEELVIPFTFVKNEGTNFEITLDAALDYGTIYLLDNKTNVLVNLSQTGSYSFVAADGDDVNRFLLKFGAVGIDDPAAAEASIEIFTAGDALYFNAKQPGNATVSIYDLLGRTVLTTEVHMSPSASVDVSRLGGTYIVRAIANGEVVSAKVFIK